MWKSLNVGTFYLPPPVALSLCFKLCTSWSSVLSHFPPKKNFRISLYQKRIPNHCSEIFKMKKFICKMVLRSVRLQWGHLLWSPLLYVYICWLIRHFFFWYRSASMWVVNTKSKFSIHLNAILRTYHIFPFPLLLLN